MSSAVFPGFHSPAVGFEQPFELLGACHGRLRRTLELLDKLVDHIEAHGHDAKSRSAAADVLRYFDVAAPAHHQDEERHVFPRLRQGADPVLMATVDTLEAEHALMESLWTRLRLHLIDWADAAPVPGVAREVRPLIAEFIQLHAGHLLTEERLVFPAAELATPMPELRAMGQEMRARRWVGPPPS